MGMAGSEVLSLAHSRGWRRANASTGVRGCAPRGARFTSPAQPLARPRVICSTLHKVSRNAQALLQRLSPPPNRAFTTCDRFPRACMHVCRRSTMHKIAEQRSRARTHMPLASLIAARCALLLSGTAAAVQGQINVLFELNGAVILQLPCDVLSQMSFAHG